MRATASFVTLRPSVVGQVLAVAADHRGCPDVGQRRHGRHVPGQRDEGRRAPGARPFRRDPGDDRDLAGQDRLEDAVHAGQLAAGRVDLDQDRGVAASRRPSGALPRCRRRCTWSITPVRLQARTIPGWADAGRPSDERAPSKRQRQRRSPGASAQHAIEYRSAPVRRPPGGPGLHPLPRRAHLVARRPTDRSACRARGPRPGDPRPRPRRRPPGGPIRPGSSRRSGARPGGTPAPSRRPAPRTTRGAGPSVSGSSPSSTGLRCPPTPMLALPCSRGSPPAVGPLHQEDERAVAHHDVRDQLLEGRALLGERSIHEGAVRSDGLAQIGQGGLIGVPDAGEVAAAGDAVARASPAPARSSGESTDRFRGAGVACGPRFPPPSQGP